MTDANPRCENTTVACPIVYGSMAVALGKKSEFATHKWRFYVRGPNFEDLSVFISKIVFSLHPSFVIPVREITEPPFEVTESGWGEFEGSVRIFFKDPDEHPVDLCHKVSTRTTTNVCVVVHYAT
jgi:YEATS domain-containing protein 4